MIKQRRNRKSNQGNSFIVVVATISFLLVLASALLVAVALCFRLKAYDINSRDNFYYLEQAMDEIYEGIGRISMKHLNDAFDETSEVIVYYDTTSKTYVTMDNTDANKLMKKTYVNKLKSDSELRAYVSDTDPGIKATLEKFISSSSNVQLLGAPGLLKVTADDNGLTIQDIILKREAQYSTVNTRKLSQASPTTFVQTITTDLTVSVPDFEVDFASVNNDISELFDFVLIGDMGVEITGIGTQSNITGNVYAAADFYNKEYNTNPSPVTEDTEKSEPLKNKVNSYTDAELKKLNGVNEESMYSGLYIKNARVSVMADKLIVPGSIAAMDCATLDILGSRESSGADPTKIWADGIVLGGNSRRIAAESNSYKGSTMKMKADSHIYDDLEVNAIGSSFSLDGTYYGYNYASTDNRQYSAEFIRTSANRKYVKDVEINDGNYIDKNGNAGHLTGQAHYNSSAIIVNGEDSTLDLSKTTSMYIAGQAYVELSKSSTKTTQKVTRRPDGTLDYGAIVAEDEADDGTDRIKDESYSYGDLDPDKKLNDNNYTLEYELNPDGTYKLDADGKRIPRPTRIQDYRTGEGLSIKSNQLAYIPPYSVMEDDDGSLYVKWPAVLRSSDYFKDIWNDLEKVPVIKTVVSGQEYYFYDFSKANLKTANGKDINMSTYMEEYAKLFELGIGETSTKGDLANFYDITDYDTFKVQKIEMDSRKIYSNSAISIMNGTTAKIEINANQRDINSLLTATGSLDNALKPTAELSDGFVYSTQLTTGLQKQYKEMKMLLTDDSTDAMAKGYARDAAESEITPINYYFDFNKLDNMTIGGVGRPIQGENTMASGYKVFLSKDNVTLDSLSGSVKGIVICKGDVTIDPNVREFEGLIVAGGKIKANHSIDFIANPEIVKSILKECDKSKGSAMDRSAICSLFRHYEPSSTSGGGASPTEPYESMKSIAAVTYEDILAFENWKKNVD